VTPMRWPELDTPCLLIDKSRLEQNLEEMAADTREHNIALRPHIKSHKMVEIARRQMELGAVGLTTAKLSEAEVLAHAGLKDLFICYPLIGPLKLRRLRDLAREARIMTIVDSMEGVHGLTEAMTNEERPLDIMIKFDVGMHRIGVDPDHALQLAETVRSSSKLRLRGVCVHEGSTYGEPDPVRRIAVAREQAGSLIAVARELRRAGYEIDIVSAGATPATLATLTMDGLTETRPGNYVFYDATQVALGVATLDQCALSVVTSVVSHASPNRAVVDAGSKTLTLDRGAHGTELVRGYGIVTGKPNMVIEKLSEEHGWLTLGAATPIDIGDQLEIIPNHACPVVNNFNWVAIAQNDKVVDRWTVDARGCVT